VLGILYPQRRVVKTYDSLGSVPDWVVACLVSWTKDDMTAHGHCLGKWTWTKMTCRMQDNGSNCRVFMVKTMVSLSRGLPQASMMGDMNNYRRRMAPELFAPTLVQCVWVGRVFLSVVLFLSPCMPSLHTICLHEGARFSTSTPPHDRKPAGFCVDVLQNIRLSRWVLFSCCFPSLRDPVLAVFYVFVFVLRQSSSSLRPHLALRCH